MNDEHRAKENERKIASLQGIADVYPRQARFNQMALTLMLAALAPYRAAYVERALPIAIREQSFPPGVAELVAIIDREGWRRIDENDFRSEHDEYLNEPIPPDEYEGWLNQRLGFSETD